jgi:hypothetical protein
MARAKGAAMTRSLVIAITFMLLGPLVLLFMLMFSTAGIFTMGPGAILAGLMYFFFWLPSLYLVYGLPFLLTGILCALAARFHRLSFAAALASAAIAFGLYLGARYLMFGTLVETDKIIGQGAWSGVAPVIGQVAVSVLPCWWLVRDRPTSWI